MARRVRGGSQVAGKAKRRLGASARRPRTPFAELAAELFRIHETAPDKFSNVAKEAGVSQRTAYYFVQIWGQIRHHPEQRRLKELGWTRLRLVAPHLDRRSANTLLAFAEKHTVQELQQFLGKRPIKEKPRCMLFRFSESDYAVFSEALIRHGAEQRGRGLLGAEQALLKLIRKKR